MPFSRTWYVRSLDRSGETVMGENNDNQSKQSGIRPSHPGDSTSAQIVGDGNTIIQQSQAQAGGTVVGLYMQGLAVEYLLYGLRPAPDTVANAYVVAVCAKPGETIQPGAELVWIDRDDDPYALGYYLPSPLACIIQSVHVAVGDIVSEGHLIATVRVWEAK
jgi:hypothetical protein